MVLLVALWVMLLELSGDQSDSSLTLWKSRRSQREGELKLNAGVYMYKDAESSGVKGQLEQRTLG